MVGGGDSAMEEAIFLTKFADECHRRPPAGEFRASKIMHDRACANPKIDFVSNAVVEDVLGRGQRQRRPRCATLNTDERASSQADGVFVAIGHDPNTELFLGQLDTTTRATSMTKPSSTRDEHRRRLRGRRRADHMYRQAVTAAGSGCMAALDAERCFRPRKGHPHVPRSTAT